MRAFEIAHRSHRELWEKEHPGVLDVWDTVEVGQAHRDRRMWEAIWSGALLVYDEEAV